MSSLLYSVTIEGSPGDAKVNHIWRPVVRRVGRKMTARLIKSPGARAFDKRADAALAEDKDRTINADRLRVTVHTYWPTRRHLPRASVGRGDVDSTVKACLDALERNGIIDDDARVVELIARKGYDKQRPRIEVEIYAVDMERVGG